MAGPAAATATKPASSRGARWYRDAMEYTGDPGFYEFDAQWIIVGPNSGWVRLYILWREHGVRLLSIVRMREMWVAEAVEPHP